MKKLVYSRIFVALLVGVSAYAVEDFTMKDPAPKYRPSKPVSYEDSYHIAGVSWNNDRAIASEESLNLPSVEPKEEAHEPKPWLYKVDQVELEKRVLIPKIKFFKLRF